MNTVITGIPPPPAVLALPPAATGAGAKATPPRHAATADLPGSPAVKDALQKQLDHLNQRLTDNQTHLKFSVDQQLDTVVVAVVDTRDGRVLQKIPSDVALRIAHALHDEQGQHGALIQATA
ncbi:MAG: flagellar protein FlaG [Stenotrophobium sp.]